MDFSYLPTPLLLEVGKCFTNQLWPFHYMSRTSGYLAGKFLEKVLLLPSYITNSGWYLLYLLVQVDYIRCAVTLVCLGHTWPTVYELHGLFALCKSFASCIVHSGQADFIVCRSTLHCMQYNLSLISNTFSISWIHWIQCVYAGQSIHTSEKDVWKLLLFKFQRMLGTFSCPFLMP